MKMYDWQRKTQKDAKMLIGATIKSAKVMRHDKNCDSVNLLVLKTDKGIFEIEGCYGGYTGMSCDEYVEVINIRKIE